MMFAPLVLGVMFMFLLLKWIIGKIFYKKEDFKEYMKVNIVVLMFMIALLLLSLIEIKISMYIYEDIRMYKLKWWLLDNNKNLYIFMEIFAQVVYMLLMFIWPAYLVCYYMKNKEKWIEKEFWKKIEDVSWWYDVFIWVIVLIIWVILWSMIL